MAYSQEDINALDDHIRRISVGEAITEYEIRGRKVKYKDMSMAEYQKLRQMMQRSLRLSKGSRRPRHGTFISRKGL